jgi:hypothetical protein
MSKKEQTPNDYTYDINPHNRTILNPPGILLFDAFKAPSGTRTVVLGVHRQLQGHQTGIVGAVGGEDCAGQTNGPIMVDADGRQVNSLADGHEKDNFDN